MILWVQVEQVTVDLGLQMRCGLFVGTWVLVWRGGPAFRAVCDLFCIRADLSSAPHARLSNASCRPLKQCAIQQVPALESSSR
jgi:hypothetical protein